MEETRNDVIEVEANDEVDTIDLGSIVDGGSDASGVACIVGVAAVAIAGVCGAIALIKRHKRKVLEKAAEEIEDYEYEDEEVGGDDKSPAENK